MFKESLLFLCGFFFFTRGVLLPRTALPVLAPPCSPPCLFLIIVLCSFSDPVDLFHTLSSFFRSFIAPSLLQSTSCHHHFPFCCFPYPTFSDLCAHSPSIPDNSLSVELEDWSRQEQKRDYTVRLADRSSNT